MRVGRWTADALLGVGGMARVYRVVCEDHPEPRALKLLTEGSADVQRRLHREAQLGRSLRHANVVEVYELIEHDGQLGLLMAYVDGPTAAALVPLAPLPVSVLDAVAADVLAGVGAAHDAGIVHRDLKPANVLLAPDPDGLVAKVADLGLARPVTPVDSLNTAPGWVPGTPAYMAPEQLRGATADTRSDVFALGVLLYELAAGVRPFVGEDHVELIDRIAAAVYTPLHEHRPDLPERMLAAVEAALRRDPERRPADATALARLWAAEPGSWPLQVREQVLARHRPTPIARRPPPRLPQPDDRFVGRHAVRLQLTTAVREERLVTVLGIGGVGKTRLALEVAREVWDTWEGGVWWVDCTQARSVDGVALAVATALGVRGSDAVGGVSAALRRRGPTLVVLDNLEQVVEHAGATVGVWLREAGEARFLTTSRVPLELPGERCVAVDVLDHHDAVALFVERARQRLPDFDLGDDNTEQVRALVTSLDGLPLAIEVAAARVRERDLGRLLAKLGERLQALPRRGVTSSAHHRTLGATLDWSWDLLASAERAALAQLSVFEGGATREAAAEVLEVAVGSVGAALDALVRHSLVRTDEAGRVRLLETVKVWAGGKLARLGQTEATERRHAAYFVTWRQSDWMFDSAVRSTFVPDVHNLEAATRRALKRRDPELAWRCLSCTWIAWTDRIREPAAELALQILEREDLSPTGVACMWHIAGMAVEYTARQDQAVPFLERAVEAALRVGDPALVRNYRGSLINALLWVDPPRAQAEGEALARACREAGDTHRLSEALGQLASLALHRGEVAHSRDLCLQVVSDEAERLHHGAHHHVGMLAIAHATLGEMGEAEQRFRQARALAQDQGSPAGIASWTHNLGWLLFERDQPDEALRLLREAQLLYTQVERPFERADAEAKIGMVRLGTEGPAAAEPHLRHAVEGLRNASRPVSLSVALCDLGRARAMVGDLDEARACWDDAWEVAHEIGASMEVVRVHLARAEWEARRGSTEVAEPLLAEAEHALVQAGVQPDAWLSREARRAARWVRPATPGRTAGRPSTAPPDPGTP